jgi:hypothetical protein
VGLHLVPDIGSGLSSVKISGTVGKKKIRHNFPATKICAMKVTAPSCTALTPGMQFAAPLGVQVILHFCVW